MMVRLSALRAGRPVPPETFSYCGVSRLELGPERCLSWRRLFLIFLSPPCNCQFGICNYTTTTSLHYPWFTTTRSFDAKIRSFSFLVSWGGVRLSPFGTRTSATSSTINPTWPDLGWNPGRRGGNRRLTTWAMARLKIQSHSWRV
jgi:hypothetical protein